MAAHEITARVYYEDTDAGGVVFYGNYMKFAERGRTELLRAIGFENSTLARDAGVLFVVRRITAEYMKPARLDDLLTIKTALKKVNNASFEMFQSIFCQNQMIFSMDVTLVTINMDGKPVRLPDNLRDKLSNFSV